MLVSCSRLSGRIENRDRGCDTTSSESKKNYLVNSSKSVKYQFTVKTTLVIDNRTKSYSTELYTLEPGDEKYLGCDFWLSEIVYANKEVILPPKEQRVVNKYNPKLVYNDSVLIGYSNDGKTIIRVERGGQGVFKNDTLVGITYDSKTMFPIMADEKGVLLIDSTKQLPRKKYSVIVEVTGQKEIKEKVKT